MQTTSQLYKTLLAQSNTEKEWKAVIGSAEYTNEITELRITRALFGDYLIGSTCSAILYLSIHAPSTIARMARVDVSYRLKNGSSVSEWIKRGSYWVNNRSLDKDTNVLTLTCFDGMMFSEQVFYPIGAEITGWNEKTMREVAVMCSQKMGVPLENSAQVQNVSPYIISAPPVGYSVRQVLGGIATAHCANWTVTADNKLRLVPFEWSTQSGAIVLGEETADLAAGERYAEYSKVILNFDSETQDGLSVEAGEDGGTVMDVPLYAVTNSTYAEEIADDILDSLENLLYQPYSAAEAMIDPAFELGDWVLMGSVYGIIGEADEICDALYSADISSKGEAETDNEFIFQPSTERSIERKIAKTSATLKVDIDRIEGKVDGKITTYRQATVPTGATTGDLWYATADVGSYKAGTWYRYSGSAWEETSEAISIPVAPAWETGTQYKKGDVVDSGDKWYAAKVDHTASSANKPPNTTYWEERQTISAVTNSQITQMVDGIELSVTSGSSGTKISMQTGGITIDSPLVDMHVKALNIEGKLTANQISTGTLSTTNLSMDGILKVVKGSTVAGFVGYGHGADGSGSTTDGVVLAATEKLNYGAGDHYLIVTNSGVRMTSGQNSLYCTTSGVHKVVNGVDSEIGLCIFG